MNDNKGDEDELLYKTINSLERRGKKQFVQNVLIISIIILALALVLVFVFMFKKQQTLEQELLIEKNKQIQKDQAKTEKLLEETSDVLSNIIIDTSMISPEISAEAKVDLLQRVQAIERKVDTITSSRKLSYKDTIFVWSATGLNVRDGANLRTASPISYLSLGTIVKKVPQIDTFYSSFGILNDNIELEGYMTRIERDTIDGYVFSGLTSPLPVYRSAKNLTQYWDLLKGNAAFVKQYDLKFERIGQVISISGKNLSINDLFLLLRVIYDLDGYIKRSRPFSAEQYDSNWLIQADNTLKIEIKKEGPRVFASISSATIQ
ncbi:hypothetical protein [Neolewinella persica]|uniref:hypothetical protein n=1 Tax=Neolewinella persica TaxID=70998 RepID=UPI00035CB85E|nr:hypothetical protein [Neolewinella persica]